MIQANDLNCLQGDAESDFVAQNLWQYSLQWSSPFYTVIKVISVSLMGEEQDPVVPEGKNSYFELSRTWELDLYLQIQTVHLETSNLFWYYSYKTARSPLDLRNPWGCGHTVFNRMTRIWVVFTYALKQAQFSTGKAYKICNNIHVPQKNIIPFSGNLYNFSKKGQIFKEKDKINTLYHWRQALKDKINSWYFSGK